MITVIKEPDVIASAWTSIGLPGTATSLATDETYVAASVRRLAGYLCPCSPKTLVSAFIESHRHLMPEGTEARDIVEQAVEALISSGDLLELSHVSTMDESVRSTWVFAAPPAFVARPSGSIFLIGLTRDEMTPLPVALRNRLRFAGATRIIDPSDGEDLVRILQDLGLQQLSADAWLRTPKPETASSHLSNADTKLKAQGRGGDVAGLKILDPERSGRWYKDRWVEPGKRSGNFIIRRPQDYGADLWAYAELVEGSVTRLLDFPPPGNRWRGCDTAWRLQMAIDHCRGSPQRYRMHDHNGDTRFDFFSPIPMWARRRLNIIGQSVTPDKCLLSFRVPSREAPSEEEFLKRYLFLSQDDQ